MDNFKIALRVFNEAPIISPYAKDRYTRASKNLTFSCESSEPISWIFEPWQNKTPIHLGIESITVKNNYESILNLINVSINNYGYYYCVKKSVESHSLEYAYESSDANRFYLYVYGE